MRHAMLIVILAALMSPWAPRRCTVEPAYEPHPGGGAPVHPIATPEYFHWEWRR